VAADMAARSMVLSVLGGIVGPKAQRTPLD
jgi:hypothetical protein